MTDPGVLVVTGASGTVGTCVLEHLTPIWPGRLCAVGRARPSPLPAADFIAFDLTDPAATAAVAARLAAGPVPGLICIAGVDSRASLDQLTVAAFTGSMQINCFAHLQLLRAAAKFRPTADRSLPVVLISSDVIGASQPGTLVYAAAKAAAEEAFRHAAADVPSPGIALLTYTGVPMCATAPGPPPPSRTSEDRPRPSLHAAVQAITKFVTTVHAPGTEEIWHA